MSVIADFANGEIGSSIRAKINRGFHKTNIVFAYNASLQTQSMAHLPAADLAVGDAFDVEFFGSVLSPGSAGVWKVYSLSGMGTAGAISYVTSVGIVLEGVNARFVYIPQNANEIDIRALGIVCDGVTTGQHSKLAVLIAAGVALGYKLTNGKGTHPLDLDRFLCTETVNLLRCACDLKFKAGTTGGNGDVGSGPGDFYTGGPGGSQAGITTQDFTLYDDTVIRLGVVVRAAGNGSNSFNLEQKIDVKGDGNSLSITSGSTGRLATCVGIRYEADDSPVAQYEGIASYCYVGHSIHDSMEKNRITCRGVFNQHHVWLSGATADTLPVWVHGSNCRHIITETLNTDTSVRWILNFENREDPGDGSPAIYIRNGKNTSIEGRVRGINGHQFICVDRASNAGANSLWLDLETYNSYGMILNVIRGKFIAGKLKCAFTRNGSTVIAQPFTTTNGSAVVSVAHPAHGLTTGDILLLAASYTIGGITLTGSYVVTVDDVNTYHFTDNQTASSSSSTTVVPVGQAGVIMSFEKVPVVWFQRVNQCALDIAMFDVENTGVAGIVIGDTANPYYALECDFGPFDVHMGNTQVWNSSGTGLTGVYPTTATALEVRKMQGGSVLMKQCWGKVAIGAGATDCLIKLPGYQRRYTNTQHADSNAIIVYDDCGPARILDAVAATATTTIPKGWAIKAIYVQNTTANAVTGGIKIGTTIGATDVVAAQAVGANALLTIASTDILKRLFSTSADQTLFIQAVTAWNSASLKIRITLERLF